MFCGVLSSLFVPFRICFLDLQMWQKKAEQVTKPFLNALGDDYSVCCQGMISKFYC